MPLAYAAIGASDALDLMRFPPEGSTPYEEALQLGSGADRFLTAANLLMTWGAQRAAGIEVTDIESGAEVDYPGVQFTDAGVPELSADPDHLFSPEGEPYLVAGTAASFLVEGEQPRRVMIISTVIEPRRLGFTWGDRDESSGFGEQQITVEHRSDGTVWAVARGFAFSQASGLLATRKQRSEMRSVIELAQAFLGALAPGAAIRTGVVKPAEEEAEPSNDSSEANTDEIEAGAEASDGSSTDSETA